MKKLHFIGIGLAALLVACPQPTSNLPVSISLSPATASVDTGGTQQYTAQALNASGQTVANIDFVFSSSQPNIASVNVSGLATAGTTTGQTTITASIPNTNLSATATLTVNPAITDIGWSDYVTGERGNNNKRLRFRCPQKTDYGTVWGTDIYTDDSSVCTAAVHAGVITDAGGVVTLEIRPGESSYTGSTRNGVTTLSYPVWGGSYVFVTN